MDQATTSQLQIAALKAFPSSPYQLAIRAEINGRYHTCPACEANFRLVNGSFPAHRFNGQICPAI